MCPAFAWSTGRDEETLQVEKHDGSRGRKGREGVKGKTDRGVIDDSARGYDEPSAMKRSSSSHFTAPRILQRLVTTR